MDSLEQWAGLTPREREVLAQLVARETNDAMARALGIDASTVKTHITRLMRKLGVETRVGLAVWAVRNGRA